MAGFVKLSGGIVLIIVGAVMKGSKKEDSTLIGDCEVKFPGGLVRLVFDIESPNSETQECCIRMGSRVPDLEQKYVWGMIKGYVNGYFERQNKN